MEIDLHTKICRKAGTNDNKQSEWKLDH